ncbi:MAG TPA: hypothetical protein VHS31_02800 [Tepidisphaeraceae bacterium]|jgi:hypothetical protein|nr:hypothetical protein [Tepidisphaeraceae bacterium]
MTSLRILLLLTCSPTPLLLLGCSKSPGADVGPTFPHPPATAPIPSGHDLPWEYVATPQRQQQILAGFAKLKVGQSREQVRALLGPPDSAVPCYESWNFNKYAGWHYSYDIRYTPHHSLIYDSETLLCFDPKTNCLLFTTSSPGFGQPDIGTPSDP